MPMAVAELSGCGLAPCSHEGVLGCRRKCYSAERALRRAEERALRRAEARALRAAEEAVLEARVLAAEGELAAVKARLSLFVGRWLWLWSCGGMRQ